jgi:hypothetical protein
MEIKRRLRQNKDRIEKQNNFIAGKKEIKV